MQYTSKKPFHSVLIIKPSGLCYRLQEDHQFKEIRYAQVTKVKVKKDPSANFFRIYFVLFVSQSIMHYYEHGLNLFLAANLILIACMVAYQILGKQIFTFAIEKGPLTAEVFSTHQLAEAKKIKKEIESHL